MTVILIIIYVFSGYAMYKYNQAIFGLKGKWHNLNPGCFEVFIVFVPFINTIWAIISWIIGPYKTEKINFNKFFKIKK